jgi:hypothetical protein
MKRNGLKTGLIAAIAAVLMTAFAPVAAAAQSDPDLQWQQQPVQFAQGQPGQQQPGGGPQAQPPGMGGPGMQGGPDSPGGQGGPGAQGNMMPFQLRYSEEEVQNVLKQVEKDDPEFYTELINLKEKMPGEFQNIIRDLIEESRGLQELKDHDPEAYKEALKTKSLERKERQLSRKYRESKNDAEKKDIEADLKPVLDELFDLHLKQRQREVKRLEEQLAKIKQDIEERKENKDKIIENRLADLIGKNEMMRW